LIARKRLLGSSVFVAAVVGGSLVAVDVAIRGVPARLVGPFLSYKSLETAHWRRKKQAQSEGRPVDSNHGGRQNIDFYLTDENPIRYSHTFKGGSPISEIFYSPSSRDIRPKASIGVPFLG